MKAIRGDLPRTLTCKTKIVRQEVSRPPQVGDPDLFKCPRRLGVDQRAQKSPGLNEPVPKLGTLGTENLASKAQCKLRGHRPGPGGLSPTNQCRKSKCIGEVSGPRALITHFPMSATKASSELVMPRLPMCFAAQQSSYLTLARAFSSISDHK
ncbi:hypothetical protein KC19_VG241500 [Ceratodon purpureus]|uniref:Uncharacterized protein n=1 Tax=Ceratodon purpureus TaxID=3225 RepID=A0A8T0HUH2_CERPU|nr:hypothetical protein KC19_VG241500 [Ceratodon purpureus]